MTALAVIPGRSAETGSANLPGQSPIPAPLTWLIRNKIDLIQQSKVKSEPETQSNNRNEPEIRTNKSLTSMVNAQLMHRNESRFNNNDLKFNISATSGEGFDVLLAQLGRHAENFLAGAESALVTRARHRHALEEVLTALRRALAGDLAGSQDLAEDLLAEELRLAAQALGRLTGRVDVEDVLNVIFRDFCIGK